MTNKQAILQLQSLREHCNSFRAVEGIWEDDMQAIDLAIKALGGQAERQTPRSPIFEADGYAGEELVYDMWRCPGCDIAFEVETERYSYCPNCGQAIDWSFDGEWPKKL